MGVYIVAQLVRGWIHSVITRGLALVAALIIMERLVPRQYPSETPSQGALRSAAT